MRVYACADLPGYTPGQYRDKLQAEYRWGIGERLGVLGFGGVGSVAPEIGKFDKLLLSVGAGPRYVLAKKNNVSLRFDAAWYVGIGRRFEFINKKCARKPKWELSRL